MTKTIILIIIMYLVLTKIMNRDGRHRPPRTTIPGPNRTERDASPAGPRGLPERDAGDDAPLAGPWNRVPGSESDGPLPGPWNKFPVPEEAGMPLPGPWDRGPVDEGRETDGGRVARNREPEPAPLTRKPRENKDSGTGRIPDEVRHFEEGPRKLPGRAVVSKQDKLTGDAKDTASEPACRERKRCRSRNPLAAVLNDRSALAGSMVLGEVIGSRGGRRRK